MSNRVKVFGRASFLRVNEPERFQGTGDPRYSANVIIEPDGEDLKACKQAMLEAAAGEWGEDKAKQAVQSLVKQNKVALVDGNTKVDKSGEMLPGYEGMYVVQAHSKGNNPPTLVKSEGGQNVKIPNEENNTIYSGCYVNAIIEFWAQNNQWGRRINAQLCGLQFVKDGEPFSGGRPAGTDDFDVVEGEAEDPGFDDDDDDTPF